jgi:uncharacterized membrane protein YccC
VTVLLVIVELVTDVVAGAVVVVVTVLVGAVSVVVAVVVAVVVVVVVAVVGVVVVVVSVVVAATSTDLAEALDAPSPATATLSATAARQTPRRAREIIWGSLRRAGPARPVPWP